MIIGVCFTNYQYYFFLGGGGSISQLYFVTYNSIVDPKSLF